MADRSTVPGLVSTIIPVHERPALLTEAVASVLAQDYRPLEILIVDDGSGDDTACAADALARAHPDCVRVLRQARAGAAAARERGRRAARGEFIQYLDSDDLLLPGKLARQVAGLAADPRCGASYGMTRRYRIGETPRDVAIKRTGDVLERMFPAFLVERWWSTCTPLYRRSVLDRAGPWAALRAEEDWEYDCRVAALGTRLHRVAAFVADVRDHDGPQLHRDRSRHGEWLSHRARAHELVLGHARRAGIGAESAEMQRFARALFFLARQCGAAGRAAESRRLLALARDAAGPRAPLDLAIYRVGAGVLGSRAAGRLASAIDRLRAGAR